ncbi:MAG: c-type cytochrome [Thermomicrobiales bacterium]|nr:c-type cytochrome [Thermomicrobiales bacterium]
MRTRLSFLVVTIAVAFVAVACGRATQQEIDSALGITPTATLSAEMMATGTAQAVAAEQTRTAAIAAADAGGSPVAIALTGDVVQGRTQYQLRCLNCHRANNAVGAPVLSGPDNPSVAISDEDMIALVRTGEGHATPPGPLTEVTISDRQLINIIAFIRDQSK